MKDQLIKGDFLTVENEKVITTAKCPICGEMAEVRKFGKGQGRISHHGHTVCFSSREVRDLIQPERQPEAAPERQPEAAPEWEPERQPEAVPERQPEGETLTFGVF